jgi:hypothetical protein
LTVFAIRIILNHTIILEIMLSVFDSPDWIWGFWPKQPRPKKDGMPPSPRCSGTMTRLNKTNLPHLVSKTMTNVHFEFLLRNSSSRRLSASIEPWGEVHQIEKGKSIRMRVEGPLSSDPSQTPILQVEDGGDVSVWGWTGSAITILPEGT